jgi:hypothetical protein
MKQMTVPVHLVEEGLTPNAWNSVTTKFQAVKFDVRRDGRYRPATNTSRGRSEATPDLLTGLQFGINTESTT